MRPLTVEPHADGVALAERFGLALYDAITVASALEADCRTLWSEDMQAGVLNCRRLRIRNPFA